ncbi:MAG: hypothetical protein RL209_5 [Pseudomonadota bacterium]
MSKFSYWESEDSVSNEFSFGDKLSAEEAQVLATLKVAENLGKISATLDELFNMFQKNPIDVSIKEMPN